MIKLFCTTSLKVVDLGGCIYKLEFISLIFLCGVKFIHNFETKYSSCFTGPLHGIPYGLKDIISVPGYKTTWGSKSFKEQVIDVEAWVYKQYEKFDYKFISEVY